MADDGITPQFDDFVAKVVPDPAQPAGAVVLSGFLGAGAEDGQVRVYSDPSLASYVDVPGDQILHAQKLPPEVSPLGGSVVWLKATAPVSTPGQAGPVAGDFLRGPIQQQLGGGFPNTSTCGPGNLSGPWPFTVDTCPTYTAGLGCPGSATCPPVTLGLGCPGSVTCPPVTRGIGCPGTVTCPPVTHGFGCPGTSTCPPVSAATPCQTWICGPGPVVATWSCGAQPPHAELAALAPAGLPNTAATVCTQVHCAPTDAFGCPRTSTCPPTDAFGCPRTSTCPPTHKPGCPNTATCTPTHQLGCPGTSTCPPGNAPTWTVMGCPSLGIACTVVNCSTTVAQPTPFDFGFTDGWQC